MRFRRIETLLGLLFGLGISCSEPPADEGPAASGGVGQGGAAAGVAGAAAGGAGTAGASTGGVNSGGTAGSLSGNGGSGLSSGGSVAGSGGSVAGSGGSVAGSGGSVAGSGGVGASGGGSGGSSGSSPGGAAGSGGSAGTGGRGAAGGGAGTGGVNPSCATRMDGALVDVRICNQTLRMWVSADAFITEAIRLRSNGSARIACFPGLIDGRDCDPTYTWHADPTRAYWTDFELETYFACPADVEGDKADWVEQVGQFCGQITTVTAVVDRR